MTKRQGPGGGKGGERGSWRPEQADRRPERRGGPADRSPAEDRPRHRDADNPIRRTGLPLIYGLHSVAAALANPERKVKALYLTPTAAERIGRTAYPGRPQPVIVRGEDIARVVGADAVHQGALAEVQALPDWDLLDIPDDAIVLVLDQVTDPHNVGAILRSAAAFGVAALVLTERHSPEATGVLAKTASGGLEHVPIVSVGNLAQALSALGERGFWRIGLDSEGPLTLDSAVATRPLCLVLGAEGKGLRRLTRERCDALARLDVPGAIKSLNVSNAAAVALYAIHRALGDKGRAGGGSSP
ncbi:MAG: 23S rRNA (guanosine(2251)-2'-O)-methyltransferase RlmB [Alsobacter sp.]